MKSAIVSIPILLASLFSIDWLEVPHAPMRLRMMAMLLRPFMWRRINLFKVEDIPDMNGKNVIVTGGNSGIGYESARLLAANGATVVITCRSLERCTSAIDDMEAQHPVEELNVIPMELDLCDVFSIERFAENFSSNIGSLDVLMLNAGKVVKEHRTCMGKYESMFFSHHVGHFYLSQLLYPELLDTAEKTGDARIVFTSSIAHLDTFEGGIDFEVLENPLEEAGLLSYGMSKLANILTARRMQKVAPAGLHIGVAQPGLVTTNLVKEDPLLSRISNLVPYGLDSVRGALTQIKLASDKDVVEEFESNVFVPVGYACKWEVCASEHAQNSTLGDLLWDWTVDTIKKTTNRDFDDKFPEDFMV